MPKELLNTITRKAEFLLPDENRIKDEKKNYSQS